MIVVSDTSPLNYLVLIGAIDVLPRLFGEVHVPPAVMLELNHAKAPAAVKEWVQSPPDWLRQVSPTKGLPSDSPLDKGEAEAIALALELHAAAILIDEKRGRAIASAQGLATIGTITVLELAAERQLLDLATALAALRKTSFHTTDQLLDDVLQRHASRDKS
jgi:predicted nucleic acid-binding protein